MVITEIQTWRIPEIYNTFESLIGESHWRRRAAQLTSEIRGNRFLSSYLFRENAIAFQLEHLRQVKLKFGQIPASEFNNRDIYPAMSFATQSLGIIENAPSALGEQFKRRIHGALKNPSDMHALRLELSAATHFARQGRRISWPEISQRASFDLLIEDVGPSGLEIECKSISEDKGRRISKREALDFYSQLWPNISWAKTSLNTGLLAVLTVPSRLPRQHKERVDLAKLFGRQILSGTGQTLPGGGSIRIDEFDVSRLGDISSATSPRDVRVVIDDVTGTQNR